MNWKTTSESALRTFDSYSVKDIETQHFEMTNERRILSIYFSFSAFFIGILVISVAFAASKIGDNLIVVIFSQKTFFFQERISFRFTFQLVFQITGSFGAPIFAVFLLGFFAPRVNGRVCFDRFEMIFSLQFDFSSFFRMFWSLCLFVFPFKFGFSSAPIYLREIPRQTSAD